MKCRKAEVSFESILAVAFIVVIISTLFAVYQFYSGRAFSTNGDSDQAVEYHAFLSQMRSHMRHATDFEAGQDYVVLKSAQKGEEKTLATYRLLDSKVICFDAEENGQTLVSGTKSAVFKAHPQINGLLIVSIFPEDQMFIPFFTSFALRGTSDVYQ